MSAKESSSHFRESVPSRWARGHRRSNRLQESVKSSESILMPTLPGITLMRKLGEGGMASVYLGQQQSTGRQVAVKVLAPHLRDDGHWRSRFLDEGRRMAVLSHPNIVPVFDWGTCNGVDFIVMEYLKGGDLGSKLKCHCFTLADVIEIIRQVAAGLDFAGEKGFVHRDVKPDNILFREDGSVCILDFGIAKEETSNTTISSQGIAIGTGAYMSPEQAQPLGRKIDNRSDLYSLGVMLYQMLAGRRPFEFTQMDPVQTFQLYLFAHVHTKPPSLPKEFEDFQPILDRLLVKDPEQRYKRGNELRQALTLLESRLPAEILGRPLRNPAHDNITQRTVVLGADRILSASDTHCQDGNSVTGATFQQATVVVDVASLAFRAAVSRRKIRTTTILIPFVALLGLGLPHDVVLSDRIKLAQLPSVQLAESLPLAASISEAFARPVTDSLATESKPISSNVLKIKTLHLPTQTQHSDMRLMQPDMGIKKQMQKEDEVELISVVETEVQENVVIDQPVQIMDENLRADEVNEEQRSTSFADGFSTF